MAFWDVPLVGQGCKRAKAPMNHRIHADDDREGQHGLHWGAATMRGSSVHILPSRSDPAGSKLPKILPKGVAPVDNL